MKKFQNSYGNILTESNTVFSYNIHTHTYFEMILYEPFHGKITINEKEISINSLTAVLIAPFDFHEIQVDKNSSSKFIKIGFNTEILSGEKPDFSIIADNIEKDDFLISLFNEIFKSSQDETYKKLLINTAVYILLRKGSKNQLINISKGCKIAIQAIKILNENFTDPITLESTARKLSITPQYLSNIFKANSGVTFSKYRNTLRLQYAAKLILETKKSITEVCFESGYGDFSHFSRSFKKYYGILPRNYSKTIKTGANAEDII